MKRAAIITVLLAITIVGYAYALGTPDFTGTWVLDTAKSEFGGPRASDMSRITLVTKSSKMLKDAKVDSDEVRSLGADGRVMTIETTRQTPAGLKKCN